MTEPLKRRSLLQSVSTPTPPLPEATIAEVAARNGFPNAPIAASVPGQSGVRRQRQPTGRNHQFNVRLRRDTLDFIYAQANERNVPVAQIVEEMVEALRRQQ